MDALLQAHAHSHRMLLLELHIELEELVLQYVHCVYTLIRCLLGNILYQIIYKPSIEPAGIV